MNAVRDAVDPAIENGNTVADEYASELLGTIWAAQGKFAGSANRAIWQRRPDGQGIGEQVMRGWRARVAAGRQGSSS